MQGQSPLIPLDIGGHPTVLDFVGRILDPVQADAMLALGMQPNARY